MNKKIDIMISIILILIVLLSGCQEVSNNNSNLPENIRFESETLELIYANFSKVQDSGNTIRIEIQYQFRNIVDRDVNIITYIEFYDAQDNLLYKSANKTSNYPKGYADETVNPLWGIVTYNGEDVDQVDYVIIFAVE